MDYIKHIKKLKRRKALLNIILLVRFYRRSSINTYTNQQIRNLIVKNHLCRKRYLTLLAQVEIILELKEHGKSNRVVDILTRL